MCAMVVGVHCDAAWDCLRGIAAEHIHAEWMGLVELALMDNLGMAAVADQHK